MKKKLFKFLSPLVVLAVFSMYVAPMVYADKPSATIDNVQTSGNPCLGTDLTITGDGTVDPASGSQISQYKIQVIWDPLNTTDGTQNDISLQVSGTGPYTYTFSAGPYHYTGTPPSTVKVRIYHQGPPGNDNQADSSAIVDTCPPKTTPTLSVTNSPQTYTGSSQTATVSGSVTGTVSDIKYDGSSTQPINVGTYAVTADFTPDNTGSYNSLNDASAGDFVIQKADSETTITCPSSVTYNGSAQTPCTVSVTGAGGLSLAPSPVYSNNINVGTATASYTYLGDSNHNGSSDSKDFSITKADPVCTIVGYSGTYDGVTHGATGSCLGVNSEVLAGLDLGFSFTNVAGGTANWIFTDTTGNYNDASGGVSIEILPKEVTVTADATGKSFGDSDPTLTYGVSGLVSPDVPGSVLDGTLSRDAGEDIGGYNINQGSLSLLNSNYSLTYVPNTFTISDKATLTVTADDQSVTYGDSDPEFTFSYSGFKNGDDESVIDSAPTCSVSVDHTDVGSYAIECSGGSDNNYSFSYVSGSLTVDPKPITVTADPETKVYGTVDPALTYTSDPLVGSDSLTGSLVRVVGEDVGTYAINQGTVDNSNYDITYISADFTITKADQTITFDPLSDKIMGDPDFDVNATASSGLPVTFTVDGTCTISDNTVHITSVGTCTVTAHQAGDENYNEAEDVSQPFSIATLLHTIVASAGSNGTMTPIGGTSVADGENQGYNITPDSGYHVDDVLVDGVSVGAVSTYTFTGVVADHTISASFAENQPVYACSDDIDNDGDGKTDYPNDPGCSGSTDDDETDPSTGGGGSSSGSRPRSAGQVLGAATEICNAVDSYMRRGYKNNTEEVKKVQAFLNGYMKWNPELVIDGLYGSKTESAVKAFQTARKENVLTPWKLSMPTGIFYKTSLTEAKRLMCPDEFGNLPIPTDLVPWSKNPIVATNR